MKFFFDSLLYSYAQIFFSNRRWFGAVAAASTCVVPRIGLMSLLGVVISNFTAHLLRFDEEKIRSGFYGFNGILFGAAILFYYELNPSFLLLIPIFIILSFLIATVIEHHFAFAFNLPGLSLPFIITLYIFIVFLANYDFISYSQLQVNNEIFSFLPAFLRTYFKSIALILFQPGILTGILLTIALLFFSRVLFVLSFVAFTINYFMLGIILPDLFESHLIITSFNSILTAFALGGSLIIPSRKSFSLVIIASLMVVIIAGFFQQILTGTNFPMLVLPFNFIVLFTIYSLKFRQEQTDLVLLYFKPGSPEENFYYHVNRKKRFDRFKYFFTELPFFGEWFVSQGFDGEFTHKKDWRYAHDFVIKDNNNSQFKNDGNDLNDYYCYNLPVSAVLDGEIVEVIDGVPENKVGQVNINKNWGNTIIIDHGEGLFSATSHLYADSVKVKKGEKVKKGDMLATCGNSGRSPYPHIHFQFQKTDRLGDATHKFPFSSFIERKENSYKLKTFDFPEEGTHVQNIETHKSLKKAFTFKLGDKIKFKAELNGKSFTEDWEVKIDIYNTLFIINNRNDIAYIYQTEKIFYFTSYAGKKNSALYYFYLSASKIPYSYHKNLQWEDSYAVSQLPLNYLRYISEFLLIYKNFLKAEGLLQFEETGEDIDDFIITNKINLNGTGIFSFINKEYDSRIIIDTSGEIKEFSFTQKDDLNFKATILQEKED